MWSSIYLFALKSRLRLSPQPRLQLTTGTIHHNGDHNRYPRYVISFLFLLIPVFFDLRTYLDNWVNDCGLDSKVTNGTHFFSRTRRVCAEDFQFLPGRFTLMELFFTFKSRCWLHSTAGNPPAQPARSTTYNTGHGDFCFGRELDLEHVLAFNEAFIGESPHCVIQIKSTREMMKVREMVSSRYEHYQFPVPILLANNNKIRRRPIPVRKPACWDSSTDPQGDNQSSVQEIPG